MNRKSLTVVVIVAVLALFSALPVGAYYANVTGELRDSVTDSVWSHGATVYVLSCSSRNELVAPVTVGEEGSFDISLAGVNHPDLCIVIVFESGGAGVPVPQEFPYDNLPPRSTGTLELGIIYTNTGPNAVSLQSVSAGVAAASPTLLAVGMALLGGLSLVVSRRKQA